MLRFRDESNRQQRVGNIVREALLEILRRGRMLDMDLLDSYLSINYVRMSPDLRIATCYVMPFVGHCTTIIEPADDNDVAVSAVDEDIYRKKSDKIIAALDKNKFGIRKLLAAKVNLKYVPELRFFYDTTMDKVSRINCLLDDLSISEDVA